VPPVGAGEMATLNCTGGKATPLKTASPVDTGVNEHVTVALDGAPTLAMKDS